ncbi:hypothetical protein CWO90_24085 [Bradyrhizobium sp. Leo121]|nr:hypothetical protein CWO90_24085 [Bradyrhizobium sp. Leo121]
MRDRPVAEVAVSDAGVGVRPQQALYGVFDENPWYRRFGRDATIDDEALAHTILHFATTTDVTLRQVLL